MVCRFWDKELDMENTVIKTAENKIGDGEIIIFIWRRNKVDFGKKYWGTPALIYANWNYDLQQW